MRWVAAAREGGGFWRVVVAFPAQPGLPFLSLLSVERIERVFVRHGNLFGAESIYSTAIMVWSFLGQVQRDGQEASCQSAVARIVAHQLAVGGDVPTADTGDYCRARAKLSEGALRDLSVEVACQYVLAAWSSCSREPLSAAAAEARCRQHLKQIAACEVANRPGRIEPRELKRRRHGYKLLQQPRAVRKQQLQRPSGNPQA